MLSTSVVQSLELREAPSPEVTVVQTYVSTVDAGNGAVSIVTFTFYTIPAIPTATDTASDASDSQSHPNVGAIAGSCVGALVFMIIVMICLLRRARKEKVEMDAEQRNREIFRKRYQEDVDKKARAEAARLVNEALDDSQRRVNAGIEIDGAERQELEAQEAATELSGRAGNTRDGGQTWTRYFRRLIGRSEPVEADGTERRELQTVEHAREVETVERPVELEG